MKQMEFLGLVIDTNKMTFALLEKKIKTYVSTMSGDFQATKNFSLKSHKVNWPFVINCPDYFTSSNPVLTSSTEANISSTEKKGPTVVMWHWEI